MIRSMTAYGRDRALVHGKDICVELKSVNNRYFDCSVKVPRMFGFLEEKIKAYIAARGIARGKIDVLVTIDVVQSVGTQIALDTRYAGSYIDALRHLREEYGLVDDISVMSVAANRDIFLVQKPADDMETDWQDTKTVLDGAINQFLSMREREGENLKRDIYEKKAKIEAILPKIEETSLQNKQGYFDKLEAKLNQVLSDRGVAAEESRILTECAIFADKIAVDEETVRLRSHFAAFDEMLQSREPVGRKLDFLLQEMNRETNTIGSKCSDLDITRMVIEMKAELEKIREQIQNIE